MSFFDKLFDDFTKENCITWLTDIGRFFKNPRRFVDQIAGQPAADIWPRYAFYFILYTFAFLLLLIGNDLAAAIRPAILGLVSSFFLILAFAGMTFLATKRNYFIPIFIYIVSVVLFTSPLVILLFTQFLNVENYAYKLASAVVLGSAQLAAFLLFPFVIENRRRRAWWIFIANFLAANLVWLVLSFVQFDQYTTDKTLMSADPILSEYLATYDQLTFRDSIPVRRVFVRDEQNKLACVFLIQDPVDSTHRLTGGFEANRYYTKAIQENISLLDKSTGTAKFERNKHIFLAWKVYYRKILAECNFKAPSEQGLADGVKNKQYFVDHDRLMMTIQYLPVIGNQLNLKREHNNLSNAFNRAEIPLFVTDRLRFFLGYILEGIYIDYFQPMKKHPYKEKFEKIESIL